MKVQVTVKPKSKVRKLVEVEENSFIAYLKSMAIEGKANAELIQLLADKYDVPKTRVDIVRGENSRIKLVEIQNEL
ncbi:MAG: DUF167 domain-containing protein [Candidatus Omnitrophica bacterium]|nr:DUF167 domain-containing protein [Candidatus Omnitrophota bacterium]